MKKSCYLIGNHSFVIRINTLLEDHGFDVRHIISEDPDIKSWALRQNKSVIPKEKTSSLDKVDYIFCLDQYSVLGASLFALAKISVIYYLNGNLKSSIAGLKAQKMYPQLIYNLIPNHEIAWYELTDITGQFNILHQQGVNIHLSDTALSLFDKSNEAGCLCFERIIDDINAEVLGKNKNLTECLFSDMSIKEIPPFAILDWNESALVLDALVRGLNFGGMENPLSLPKLIINDKPYYVIQTTVIDCQSQSPGKVNYSNQYLEIATGQGKLRIVKILDTHGEEVEVSQLMSIEKLSDGNILENIAVNMSLESQAVSTLANEFEPHWQTHMFNVRQLELPILNANDSIIDSCNIKTTNQSINCSEIDIKSALILFLSRISGQASFDLYIDLNVDAIPYIDQCIPMRFDFDFDLSYADNLKLCNNTLNSDKYKVGYAKDFFLRQGIDKSSLPKKKIVLSEAEKIHNSLSDAVDLKIEIDQKQGMLSWHFDQNVYSTFDVENLQQLFKNFLLNVHENDSRCLAELNFLTATEFTKMVKHWNATDYRIEDFQCIQTLFEQQVIKSPAATAVSFYGATISYKALNTEANKIAHYLISKKVRPDQLVAVMLDRSIDMIAAMLGILKSGAAYLPLDPSYPMHRIEYMLSDSDVVAMISHSDYRSYFDKLDAPQLIINESQAVISLMTDTNPNIAVQKNNLAYIIYTSGSTGQPKGVMVEHGNVTNFFAGMDEQIEEKCGVWLAVTSISFDISVLELFWTLCRGYEVALYADNKHKSFGKKPEQPVQEMDFSLFYWNVADEENNPTERTYHLLMESAKYADENSFKAVWTPERHFNAFGGIFPNPAITSAALASSTKNIQIRAGSCVLPLHHPVRVAEDWSMIDNISQGRVGIAIAAGWQPNDFVIMPENHADAKNVMFESLATVKKLWRGDTLSFAGPNGKLVEVRTLPRPVQQELPIWVTAASNPETFRKAGEIGANVLTHLLGQTIEDVEKNIVIYRAARKEFGHEGFGTVTVMLHTLIGDDNEKVKSLAMEPLKNYLKSAMFLVKDAAWHYPLYKTISEKTGKTLDDFFDTISSDDMDDLLTFAFQRYYNTSGLFGTPEHCQKMINSLGKIGVTEIACLIDYGIDTDTVLAHLPNLNELRKINQLRKINLSSDEQHMSIADIIKSRKVTHLQCTPSMATLLLRDEDLTSQLSDLKHILVGGESLSETLAKEIKTVFPGKLSNMYGPTETTIWSTTSVISDDCQLISIGKPILNTKIYILDKFRQPVPIGVTGELHIAGDGVVRGYHKQVELTEQRFIDNPFSVVPGEKMYATGDLATYTSQGDISFLGRMDNQVKIRGYRIELGEVDYLLQQHSSVLNGICVLHEDEKNDKRLVAYIVPKNSDTFDASLLKEILKEKLPDFMMPSYFIKLNALPLTPNGKIDRFALPSPNNNIENVRTIPHVKPENQMQDNIISLWRNSLGVNDIGLDDNFFDIGGHSLLVVEVLSELRKIVVNPIKMTDLFRYPTVRQISQYIAVNDVGNSEENNDAKIRSRAEIRKSARLNTLNRRRLRQQNPRK